jgi:glycine C-acetyltransferase
MHRVPSSLPRRLSTSSRRVPMQPPSPLSLSLVADLTAMKAAGTYKTERVIVTPQSSRIAVATSPSQPVLNMCANNYLGLANHPNLIAAAKAALDSHGFGMASVRFICGTQDLHKKLEARIAAFHGTEDAILFPSCFDANAGIFEAILSPEDAVISDEKNHASIIDGIRLCKAQRLRYKNRDMADLEAQLIAAKDARIKLIVTDGVFSMDGTVAPLAEIVALAQKYGASTFIDECHATGFFGKTGRGTDEHTGTQGKIDIINSTLGKAMGGATGGYTAGTKELVDVLRNKARPYLFSNSVAPAIVGASLAVFDMLEKDSVSTRGTDFFVFYARVHTEHSCYVPLSPFPPSHSPTLPVSRCSSPCPNSSFP